MSDTKDVIHETVELHVVKRDNRKVAFEENKITTAAEPALKEEGLENHRELSLAITADVVTMLKALNKAEVTVEEMQDMVFKAMSKHNPDAAIRFAMYRQEKRRTRSHAAVYDLLDATFISKYKHLPSPMDQLGNFVYYRTYSRPLDAQGRREDWWETVRRAVEYNCSLDPSVTKEEAQKLYDNVFHLRQFLSGRTFWVGGTEISYQYPMANFNCSHRMIDGVPALVDTFYLLMIGSGVGVNITKQAVKNFPPVRTNYQLIHEEYVPHFTADREDNTSIVYTDTTLTITVGDSKEGWVDALEAYLQTIFYKKYAKVKTIIMNYDNVRPKGETLKRFGGTASGHTSLVEMYRKIESILKKASIRENKSVFKIKPIDALDICNILGENVVAGGVRRTAELAVLDADETDVINAKANLYTQDASGKYNVNKDIIHRQMSNNSIYHKTKPSKETLRSQLKAMRYSGEPGAINGTELERRHPHGKGVNPCAEILLDNKGLCNLVTENMVAFVEEITKPVQLTHKSLPVHIKGVEIPANDIVEYEGNFYLHAKGNFYFNLTEAAIAFNLGARASLRMTLPELELPEWNEVQDRDRLIGVSFTGWQDAINLLGFDMDHKKVLLEFLRGVVHNAADTYADNLGINRPVLKTTIKPEGTLSQLPGVSSGIHFAHSPYFIRRVRISSDDPIAKVVEELNWNVFPEVGEEIETCRTKVVEFPCKAPQGKTKYDVGAIEQLEEYLLFMRHYVDHNCSITVHVRGDKEWDEVLEWWYENWDETVALSFLDLEDNFYELLPYEAISEEKYHEMKANMVDFRQSLISKYEDRFKIYEVASDCDSGLCPTR